MNIGIPLLLRIKLTDNKLDELNIGFGYGADQNAYQTYSFICKTEKVFAGIIGVAGQKSQRRGRMAPHRILNADPGATQKHTAPGL